MNLILTQIHAFLIGDMPYMSYQISNEEAVRNAGRFIRAGMDCVKVEGAQVERIKAIADSGIMVMSHLGLTPHTRAKLGGYRVQGKTAKQAEKDQAAATEKERIWALGVETDAALAALPEGTIVVYTDGACPGNQHRAGRRAGDGAFCGEDPSTTLLGH